MKNLGILFGGQSVEHEISLISAQNIIKAVDKSKYNVVPIGIAKDGQFLFFPTDSYFLNTNSPKTISLDTFKGKPVVFLPGKSQEIVGLTDPNLRMKIDIVFPVLHGHFGEDGTVQCLLRLANIPFIGSNVLGSAVGMDKDVTKRLLKEANIPVAKSLTFSFSQKEKINFDKISQKLGRPFFVKPANAGSSVGINKVDTEDEFVRSIERAFKYDKKIIIEEAIKGREIECSVLGNDKPIASLPGEVIPHDTFYSYKAKYLDKNGADLLVPAELSKEIIKKIQDLSIKTFRTLGCEGMARVDGFLADNGKYFINEVNTIPGFTNISMYPKLWKASGITYNELVDKLIGLALERFEYEKTLKTSYNS